MAYWTIGVIALTILIVINHDVLFDRNVADVSNPRTREAYRRFLLGVSAYYVTDALWGLIDLTGLTTLLYIDTVAYFIAMATSVLLWMRYVVEYLDERAALETAFMRVGIVFFCLQLAAIVANFFMPVMFWFGEAGEYHAGPARYAMLGIQVIMFLSTSIYTLFATPKGGGSARRRNLTVALFGIAMVVLVIMQMYFPLLPLYAVGYLLGTCVLHAFVVEDEKDERRLELEEHLRMEERQKVELDSAKLLAYTDALTGVKSKHAYAEAEQRMDARLAEGTVGEFAVSVFDINGLKYVNDTKGHEAGDELIIDACKLICTHFAHSPVYRIGGDEFVAIVEGDDYRNRNDIHDRFDRRAEKNLAEGGAVVSMGISEFNPVADSAFNDVFERADRNMYRRKGILEDMGAHGR